MSDIDLILHYRVGLFATLPIYMAREDGCWLGRPRAPDPSSVMRKGDLAIGGGGGEHAALVIHSPVHCVARFLHDGGFEDAAARDFPSVADPKFFTFCEGYSETQWIKEFHGDY